MTDNAAYYGTRALQAIADGLPDYAYDHARIAAHESGLTLTRQLRAIAQTLSDVAHLEVGADPRPLDELTQPMAQKFMREAATAIQAAADPFHRLDATHASIADALAWSGHREVTPSELAAQTIAFYRARAEQ